MCASMRHIYGTLFDYTGQHIFLILRPEIKVTVTDKQYTALCDTKMCPQTKFGIPMSNIIGFMLVTRFF